MYPLGALGAYRKALSFLGKVHVRKWDPFYTVLGSFACHSEKIEGHPPIYNGPQEILKEHPSLCVLSVLLAGEARDRTMEKWKFLPTCVHESPGLGASELSFLPGCAHRERTA